MANLKDILPAKSEAMTFSRVIPINAVLIGILTSGNLRVGFDKVERLEAGALGVMVTVAGKQVLVPWANVASADPQS